MAEDSKRNSSRIIKLAREAENDQIAIYLYTEQLWGSAQATNYINHLQTIMHGLAENPDMGPIVSSEKSVRIYTVKWKNARQGHRIFYKQTNNGISIIRILHTSMHWPDHLP